MEYEIDYEHIYNSSPDMCFSVEAVTGRIVSCNETLLSTFGYTRQECLSMSLMQFYHPNYHQKVKENLESFSNFGSIIHTDFQLVKKNGEVMEASLQLKPVKDKYGITLYSNAVWRDISELKEAERKLQKEKIKVEAQNSVIAGKSKDIIDSINYAKRIQSAILPSTKNIREALPESFILYKPKDIVAGDFYWMENIEEGLLFAVADCTGHGVPGALVSLICNGALNHSVREFGLKDTCKILDKTRALVVQEFEMSDENVSDGMDIGLFKLVGQKLYFSAANNPLWIIRKGKLIEIKGDKQAIGKSSAYHPFTTHKIELQKGDRFYLMSDGYRDQFGGPDGKKYKTRRLKEFLISIQQYSMSEQYKFLDIEFEDWKGDLDQIDDVCIMGVSV